MADVLSGKVNPSGKLPFTFPKRLADNGAHYAGENSYPGIETDPQPVDPNNPFAGHMGVKPEQEYTDDILVGYRWHDTKKIPAMFPFGHGLSYTTFKYGKPTVSAKEFAGDGSITVTVPVTNTGSMEGKEVVQLYISDEKSSLPRPLKELKGFSKVSLAPGATANVEFTIKADDLKFFDDKAHAWVAEPGKFKALIGSSSTDIRATVPFSFR